MFLSTPATTPPSTPQVSQLPTPSNSPGETPLLFAVERGHASVVHYLSTAGVPLPPDFLLKLNFAEMRNGARMINLLVENGADPLVHNSNGDSVLHLVIAAFDEEDALETAMPLVSCGCDPFESNSRGETPLLFAVERGHTSVVRYLLSTASVPLPPDFLLKLNFAKMRNGAQMINLLVENGTDPLVHNSNGDSVLHLVIAAFDEEDALETAMPLVSCDCDPFESNSRGETPVRIAVERGHASVVRYLLSTAGVPLPPDFLLNLDFAKMRNGARMINLLVENGADPLVRTSLAGDSVLHRAIATSDERDVLEITKLLVGYGCDPLEPNFSGETPLNTAVDRWHVPVMYYLISLGTPPIPHLSTLDLIPGSPGHIFMEQKDAYATTDVNEVCP